MAIVIEQAREWLCEARAKSIAQFASQFGIISEQDEFVRVFEIPTSSGAAMLLEALDLYGSMPNDPEVAPEEGVVVTDPMVDGEVIAGKYRHVYSRIQTVSDPKTGMPKYYIVQILRLGFVESVDAGVLEGGSPTGVIDFSDFILSTEKRFHGPHAMPVLQLRGVAPENVRAISAMLNADTHEDIIYSHGTLGGTWHRIFVDERVQEDGVYTIDLLLTDTVNETLYFKYQAGPDIIKGHMYRREATQETVCELMKETYFDEEGHVVGLASASSNAVPAALQVDILWHDSCADLNGETVYHDTSSTYAKWHDGTQWLITVIADVDGSPTDYFADIPATITIESTDGTWDGGTVLPFDSIVGGKPKWLIENGAFLFWDTDHWRLDDNEGHSYYCTDDNYLPPEDGVWTGAGVDVDLSYTLNVTFIGFGAWSGTLTLLSLIDNPFWSADGDSFDEKTFEDLITHLNFDDNVIVKASTASSIEHVLTWPMTKEWTPSEYLRLIAWLGSSVVENMVPAEVTAGTGIGPNLDWADNGNGCILFVQNL